MALRILFLLLLINNAQADDIKTITAEDYYNQNPSIERKAILDFITSQFDGKTISTKEIDKLWNNVDLRESQSILRFQIVNQQLYTHSSDITGLYFLDLLEYFKQLIKKYKINDIDFIVFGRDEIESIHNIKTEDLNIPSFMMSKNLDSIYEKDKLLFPDAFMFRKTWETLYNEIESAKKHTLWKNKHNKIFWRGSSTGWDRDQIYNLYGYNLNNFDKLSRIKLVMLSKLYPDLIDAAMAFYPQFSKNQDGKNLRQILDILFPEKNRAANKDFHLKYKYLISVDGNTCAWERVPWIMLSNSVLVKQETNNIEWFYSAMKPYEHYAPLKEDLTDIFEKINWMKENDNKLQEISSNAQKFVQDNLKPEDIDIHMVITLNEYSKIQTDKEIKATLIPADNAVSIFSLFRLLIHKKFKQWYN